jgi:hypothetical protein
MTHTPGPWKVMGEDVVLMRDEREVVAWVGDIDGQMIDNAHLIAAAPDMLEAMEEVVAITENLPVCPFCGAVKGVQSHRPDCLSHEINAAIRKARGEDK